MAPSHQPAAPYLSVVATARNDDHGGNLLGRMQVFVDAWINQSKRHGLNSELILVEWNPPRDRERLANALRWPADTAPCQVRIIAVPPEVHARYRYAAPLPLYQMIAKNVGIRRARGEFILATNIDIVFSDELVEFLASQRLEKSRMYRIDRHDVMSDVPVNGTLDQQLEYCRTHLIRLCARESTFPLTPGGLRRNAPDDITSVHSGLSFGDGWSPVEHYAITGERFRWLHNDAEILARVPEGGGILTLEVEPGPGLGPMPQPLQAIDNNGGQVAEWKIAGRTTVALVVPSLASDGMPSFRLRVPGGGSAVLSDQRILNLAVFHCDWAPQNPAASRTPSFLAAIQENSPALRRMLGAYRRIDRLVALFSEAPRALRHTARLLAWRGADVFERGLDFQTGPGWSYLEEAGGERFRWVSKDAPFAIRVPTSSPAMALLVEPGPSLSYQPFHLLIRHLHDRGEIIAQAPVRGLTYLEFPIPAAPGTITTLCLTADREGTPSGSDPRLLNFRVLACGSGAEPEEAMSPRAADAWTAWPAFTIDARPVTKDWKAELEPFRRQIAAMGKPAFLHTFACGDFTMMSREDWFNLRGYPELDLFSIHLDSFLCYAAHYAGVGEELLREPMRIYHIEHGVGTGWTPEGQAQLQARVDRTGIQSISHDDLAWLISEMRTLHAPIISNLEDWGLVRDNLPETLPVAARIASEVGT